MSKYSDWSQQLLEEEVRRHNYHYFVENSPILTDAEFDKMVEVLRQKFPKSKVLKEIGSDLTESDRPQVKHAQPMLSLDKCYSFEDLTAWAEKTGDDFVVMPKFDGMALSLRYDNKGKFYIGATRGSGKDGEDISSSIQYIKDIPLKITLKNIEVRGEAYMPLSVFREEFAETFASPRNLTAGALKQKDPSKTKDYKIRFFAFDLLGAKANSEMDKRELLAKAGFKVAKTRNASAKKLVATCEEFISERTLIDYETDGVVVRLNKVAEQERLGATSHHPRYAIAYKYQGDSAVTTLVDIEWSVSRSLVITPVGIIKPVPLSGAVVNRVSLHNLGFAKKMGLGIGAEIEVMRRGGVIPHVERLVNASNEKLNVPKTCPSCGSKTKIDGDFIFCTNEDGCTQALIGSLKHFLDSIGCEGFGPKILEQLVETGIVTDLVDIFELTEDKLLSLPRMGKKLANKLMTNISNARIVNLEDFLRGLGINDLGAQSAQILAGMGNLETILNLKKEDLLEMHGIGEEIANHVTEGFRLKSTLIDKLRNKLDIRRAEQVAASVTPISGKSVLFTGSLVSMERAQAQAKVKAAGGRAASSISSKLDYLVIGDAGGAGSKLKKALKLQEEGAMLQVLTETEFLNLLKEK